MSSRKKGNSQRKKDKSKHHRPSPPQGICNQPAGYLKDINRDLLSCIQQSDLQEREPLFHKKEDQESLKESQVFQETISTEFEVLKILIKLQWHIYRNGLPDKDIDIYIT